MATSEVYPQIKPGEKANDKIMVLEDTNRDGVCDRSTVFAEVLLIPTGLAPDGKGGCYVGASTELLHFADHDGDGKADERTVVFSASALKTLTICCIRSMGTRRVFVFQSIDLHP